MGRAVTLAPFGHPPKIVGTLNTFPQISKAQCVGETHAPLSQPLHPGSQEEHLFPGLFPFLSFLSGCSGRYCRLGRLGWDFKSQGKPGEGCGT